MRISEAMRRGAAMRPQCNFILFDGVGSCAIGAAMEGAGIEQNVMVNELCTAYPEWNPILNALVPYPLGREDISDPCCLQVAQAKIIVMYLNDEHKWTREDIADWLEGVEDKLIAEGKYIPCTT